MRRALASVLIACLFVQSVACGAKVPPATPSPTLLKYEQVAQASLQAVSAAATAANAITNPATNAPLLSNADTAAIVTGVAKVNAVIVAAQTGWPAALQTAWATFENSLNAAQKQQLVIVLAAGDVAVAALVAAAGGVPNLPSPDAIHGVIVGAAVLQSAMLPTFASSR